MELECLSTVYCAVVGLTVILSVVMCCYSFLMCYYEFPTKLSTHIRIYLCYNHDKGSALVN